MAKVRFGDSVFRCHAAPMPEIPAPTTSTSRCSIAGPSLFGNADNMKGQTAANRRLEQVVQVPAALEEAIDDHPALADVKGDRDAPLKADDPQARPEVVSTR